MALGSFDRKCPTLLPTMAGHSVFMWKAPIQNWALATAATGGAKHFGSANRATGLSSAKSIP